MKLHCIYPKHLYVRGKTVALACGKCLHCRILRQREWGMRLYHESAYWTAQSFVTLTYDEEHLPPQLELSKTDAQQFIKKLRKKLRGRTIKYFLCGEYGPIGGRPHYHAILFGIAARERNVVNDAWQKGFITIAPVTRNRISYVAKYTMKDDRPAAWEGREPPWMILSSGIGRRFAEEHKDFMLQHSHLRYLGVEQEIPRYYRKLIQLDPESNPEAYSKYMLRLETKSQEDTHEWLEQWDGKFHEYLAETVIENAQFEKNLEHQHRRKGTL